MSARDEILGRIHRANRAAPEVPDVPRAYRTRAESDREARLDTFAEVVADYRATVSRVREHDVAGAVADRCAARGVRRLLVPDGLPDEWLPAGPERVRDDALTARELDGVDAVVTTCAVAIAETGTIVLDGGAGQGRRAVTLVPDVHVCIVRASQIVTLVPEAVARLAERAASGHPLTWISGPSATSDIELIRVEGVHGPRQLDVIVVLDEEPYPRRR